MTDPSGGPAADPLADPRLDAALRTQGPVDAAVAERLITRGRERLDMGDAQGALIDFRRVVGHTDPAITSAALLGYGDALYRLDDERQAAAAWEAIVRLRDNPSTYQAWRNLAGVRVRAGELQSATEAYRQADRRAPAEDKAEIAARLGWLAKETGNAGAANGEEKVHFRPNLADRTKAGALDAAASVSSALDRQLSRIAPEPSSPVITRSGCSARWSFYCGCVEAAVSYASARGKSVFIVTQPYIAPAHRRQQNELAAMLRSRFARDRRVHDVDLGEAIDLRDRTLAYDGMHLVARGNAILAERLAKELASAEY